MLALVTTYFLVFFCFVLFFTQQWLSSKSPEASHPVSAHTPQSWHPLENFLWTAYISVESIYPLSCPERQHLRTQKFPQIILFFKYESKIL